MATLTKIYSDIDFTFTRKPVSNDIALSYDAQAVARSIRNLLSCKHYERLWNPDLGSNIETILFEPISPSSKTSLENEVSEMIDKYEPRVNLKSVVVTPKPDENSYSISITYYLENATIPTTITILLERNR
jgi:phage baseplate assembly protein W